MWKKLYLTLAESQSNGKNYCNKDKWYMAPPGIRTNRPPVELTWFHHCRFRHNSLTSKQIVISWAHRVSLSSITDYISSNWQTTTISFLTAKNETSPPILQFVVFWVFLLNIPNTLIILMSRCLFLQRPQKWHLHATFQWYEMLRNSCLSQESNFSFPLHAVPCPAKCFMLVSHPCYCTVFRLTPTGLHHVQLCFTDALRK